LYTENLIKEKEDFLYKVLNFLIKTKKNVDELGVVNFSHDHTLNNNSINNNNNITNNINDNNVKYKTKTSIIDEYINTNEDLIKDYLGGSIKDYSGDYSDILNFKLEWNSDKGK